MNAHGAHALIVEDELISGMGVQHVLEELGFTSFAFAATGQQAADACRLRRPDLMTVDLHLREGDGLSAAKNVRDSYGVVPTVFVTGSPEAVNVRGAVVVEKPLSAGALARAVNMARLAASGA